MASRKSRVEYLEGAVRITSDDVDSLSSFVWAAETLGLVFRDKFVVDRSDWPRKVSATMLLPPLPVGASPTVNLDGGDLGRGTAWRLVEPPLNDTEAVLSIETQDQINLIRFLFAARKLGFEHWLWDHFGVMTIPIYGASGGFGMGVMSYIFFPRDAEPTSEKGPA